MGPNLGNRCLDARAGFTGRSDYKILLSTSRKATDIRAAWILSNQWSPANLHLLNGHAPELVRFSAPGFIHIKIDLKSPFMFTSNMRHLQLEVRYQLRAADLLEACMRMPLLETLELSIAKLIHENTTVRSGSLPRPTMTKLKVIDVTCLSLDIYPAFIDRIKPAVGCALRATH